MNNFLTYMYLLTPLHTGGSADEGNLMGIAREVHTEFPYLPSSSLRGRIRAAMENAEDGNRLATERLFGRKLKSGSPTEGEVWFADASLLFFPIASMNHHLVWITCPLWLERWSRWVQADAAILQLVEKCRVAFTREQQQKAAVLSFRASTLHLQTALLGESALVMEDFRPLEALLKPMLQRPGLISQILKKSVVLSDENCIALVEMGLQREVRVALKEDSKTVQGGSFRSEEAIPPETVLFFPWGTKRIKAFKPLPEEAASEEENQQKSEEKQQQDEAVRQQVQTLLTNNRVQFGGLEGLGRGWADLTTLSAQ